MAIVPREPATPQPENRVTRSPLCKVVNQVSIDMGSLAQVLRTTEPQTATVVQLMLLPKIKRSVIREVGAIASRKLLYGRCAITQAKYCCYIQDCSDN
jgi:hypothetical protein